MDPSLPIISIIAVNFNNSAVTVEFLRSIREHNTYENIEVIIVDNGSAEDPSEACREVYPEVRMLLTGKNLGFAGGNNAGIRVARGSYFFMVNNDTEFTAGLLEGLMEVFRVHRDAGVVCPKFHYYFRKGTIEYAGYGAMNVFTGRNGMIGCGERDEGQYDQMRETNFAHGGAMLVSREVVQRVGTMYEPFFLYYEELDWSARIRKMGYKIYYQPASLIYHKESMTTGKASPLKTFYLTRNRILFMRRNTRLPVFLVFASYFIFFTMPKNTIVYLFRGNREHLRSFWRGILWQFNPSIGFNGHAKKP
ncbi:MAG TPA: glycosyltransferase family 2 protein [Puia sp.]|uniref:glycosyltransferase family 2 protein n=1 Tax=Puia sp. TaxID=2045100 RepID=UPI002CA3A6DD|nr:glycosyltransferase family 2 protein [Puia sp.]HVU95094.1 glycosyltransferase family 2 protein [Puia sp.]